MQARTQAPAGNEDLVARLQTLRSALGLSQEQLARRLGVSFATVNRWESGRTSMSARGAGALAALVAETAGAQTSAARASGFIGRSTELATVRGLLEQHCLVCIVGPGGSGKTSLAARVAAESDRAVTVVALGSVRDPGQVKSTIAAALAIRDQPGRPAEDSLVDTLIGRSALLLIDGVENVRAGIAETVTDLLAGVPDLQILLTSRSVVNLPAGASYAIPALRCSTASADLKDIATSDAVMLFVDRARRQLSDFELTAANAPVVAELCRRLGGLPLAIELIAGWVGTLSVQEIVAHRLTLLRGPRSGPDVLHEVLEASYSLLGTGERRLLPALSVFAGTFTLDDAAAVTAIGHESLVHGLRGLAEAAWLPVSRDGPQNRFTLLDPTREFAALRLESEGGSADIAARHAAHFAQLAHDSEDGLVGPDTVGWRARVDAAWADVAQALSWAETGGELEIGLRAAAGLWRWWLTQGRLAEGRRWLERLLARVERDPNAGVSELTVGRALAASAVLAAENGDYPSAVAAGTSALEYLDGLGERAPAAFAATVVGSAHRYLGRTADARRYFERAMTLRRELGDRRGLSVGVNNLALLALDDGDLDRARTLFEESLLFKRQLGEPRAVALGLANLSDVLIRTRQTERAAHAIAEAVALAAELGDRQLMGTLRCNQGDLDSGRGAWSFAVAHYATAVDEHRAAGHLHDVVVALVGQARALIGLGRAAEAISRLREAEAIATGIANAAHLSTVRAALADLGEIGDNPPPPGVTPREADILAQVGRGLRNKEIAAELHLSVSTVERHLATIYRKLGLRGRVDAARLAVATGLAPTPR